MSQKQPHSLILLTGCNIEPKRELLIRAAELLHQRVGRVVAHSDIYLTEAWGFSADELFANMALELQTTLEPLEVLDLTQAIEQELGRDRAKEQEQKAASGERYCSRTMDIDLMFYDDQVIQSERLTVPHPLMQEREFALRPMAEIAPHMLHPTLGRSIGQMLEDIEKNNDKTR
jgi:2-amino-4-hydroxy-6-hydroxymethyldihydropteridine diphosphokinase